MQRISQAVEIEDPLSALRCIVHLPYPFLLHSPVREPRGRWSFFGADPFAVFGPDDYDDAIALWRRIAAEQPAASTSPDSPPFTGGAVGCWAYDFGRRLERLPEIATDDLLLPAVRLGFYDVVGAFDHQTRRAWLFSSGLPLDGAPRDERATARLEQFHWLLRARPAALPPLPKRREGPLSLPSTHTRAQYLAAVETVKAHIAAGDIFQANLSQRWTLPIDASHPTTVALALHEALALFSPAPFAAFFGAPDHAIASASPERFLELRGGRVETRPIKGTRPRGATPAEDARLAQELRASAKDRAENVMIVDVLRNDLGRVCESGSVTTTGLCELESFPQVHHLTSTIEGRLRPGVDPFGLLHACFPGGSITGAPKIRAMEIIETLEPVRRHVYTGSIGYVDWSGNADWNIAIRTALVTPRAIHFSAGGGITADSDADAEYVETLHKAEGLCRALERVTGPVTLAPELAAAP